MRNCIFVCHQSLYRRGGFTHSLLSLTFPSLLRNVHVQVKSLHRVQLSHCSWAPIGPIHIGLWDNTVWWGGLQNGCHKRRSTYQLPEPWHHFWQLIMMPFAFGCKSNSLRILSKWGQIQRWVVNGLTVDVRDNHFANCCGALHPSEVTKCYLWGCSGLRPLVMVTQIGPLVLL